MMNPKQAFANRTARLVREGAHLDRIAYTSESTAPVDRAGIPVGTCITTGCDRPTVEDSQSCAEHTAEAIYGTAGQG